MSSTSLRRCLSIRAWSCTPAGYETTSPSKRSTARWTGWQVEGKVVDGGRGGSEEFTAAEHAEGAPLFLHVVDVRDASDAPVPCTPPFAPRRSVTIARSSFKGIVRCISVCDFLQSPAGDLEISKFRNCIQALAGLRLGSGALEEKNGRQFESCILLKPPTTHPLSRILVQLGCIVPCEPNVCFSCYAMLAGSILHPRCPFLVRLQPLM